MVLLNAEIKCNSKQNFQNFSDVGSHAYSIKGLGFLNLHLCFSVSDGNKMMVERI